MFKKIIIIIFMFLISLNLFSEKWVGKAATYQKKDGTKTANGDLFDSDGYYGACNGFKLGAEVIIINTVTKEQVKVIINDRINEDAEYFILLTPKAAKEIGIEWQTNIVIIEADFSDINTIDKLEINGLISEGEIDVEALKKFPDIDLQIDQNKTEDMKKPDIEKDEIIPKKEEKKIAMDYDENYLQNKETKNIYPDEEKLKDPDKIDLNKNFDKDEKSVKTETDLPNEDKLNNPDKDKNVMKMDNDYNINKITETDQPKEDKLNNPDKDKNVINMDKDYTVNKITETDQPKEDKLNNPDKDKDKIAMDKDFNIDKKITEKDDKKDIVINWDYSLLSGKIYIRFSTTFDKAEAERRYKIFYKIFKNKMVGISENNKFILFLGPVNKEDVDKYLEIIRSYGYKDAYIIKGK